MLGRLDKALKTHRIAACLFSSAINNPLGCMSSDEYRQDLVALLEKYQVPLIEDDVYGELYFEGPRPKPAQFFSRKGLVLTVGSFSKTAAPGYRIGWLLPGKYGDQARKFKRALSCSSGLLQQLTLAEFMAAHDYDRHLNRLRPILKHNAERMASCVEQHFPPETGISRPRGGSVLWLEMAGGIDSETLFDAAMERCISIVPGDIFSAGKRYSNFIRLSFGHPWSEEMENGIATLGQLVKQQMKMAA
jgi:DNA-binding transcriptional MocR family regulator